MDGGGTGVPGGGTEHGDRLAGTADLFLIEIAEDLERKILEGKSRPVEKLEDKEVVIKRLKRGNCGVREGIVCLVDYPVEGFLWDVGGKELEELQAKAPVIQRLPFIQTTDNGRQ
jgi:hypothetical protein